MLSPRPDLPAFTRPPSSLPSPEPERVWVVRRRTLLIAALAFGTLAGAVIGGWFGWRFDRDPMDVVMGTIIGSMLPAVLFGVVILAGLGIQFVLS